MFTSKSAIFLPVAVFLISNARATRRSRIFGRPLTPEEVQKLDITIFPDGKGLPAGSGSVSAGAKVYSDKCEFCHGAQGKGGPQDRLTGGIGTLASDKPVKTPISYYRRPPFSTTPDVPCQFKRLDP